MRMPPPSLCKSGRSVDYVWFGSAWSKLFGNAAIKAGEDEFILALTRNTPAEYEGTVLAHYRGEYRALIKRAMRGKLNSAEVRDSQNRVVEPLYEIKFEVGLLVGKDGKRTDGPVHIRHYHSEHAGYNSRVVGHLVVEKTIEATKEETLRLQDADIDRVVELCNAYRST